MKRKIVQHGSSSLTITLPHRWVAQFGLGKGEEVEVTEEGATLRIATAKEVATAAKEFSAEKWGTFTRNNLSHLYQLGYDEVIIRFTDPKTLEEIKSRLPECMGFEIIDQKSNMVQIKSIAATLEGEFDMLLRKAFLITTEMAESMIAALEQGERSKFREIRSMESLNNKFTDICLRILNKRGYRAAHRTMQMYEVVKSIERIADELKYLCDTFGEMPKIEKPLLQIFRAAVAYYRTFAQLFYTPNATQREQLHRERRAILEQCTAQMAKGGKAAVAYHHIYGFLQRTHDAIGAHAALVL